MTALPCSVGTTRLAVGRAARPVEIPFGGASSPNLSSAASNRTSGGRALPFQPGDWQ